LKKLAIVGSAEPTREQAPFGDPNFDIWVLNEAPSYPWCKRWDACFQMHPEEIYAGHNDKDPHHWEWLQQKRGKPIYMQAVDPRVPDSVEFPLASAMDLIGSKYLAATICDCLALAILQGYEHIEVWGVELSFTEYQYQAECWRTWIGFARGRLGAEHVVLHSGQHLFVAPLYGYEGIFKFGAEYFDERAKRYDATWKAADKLLQNIKRQVERMIAKKEYDKVAGLMPDLEKYAQSCAEAAGRLSEAERYREFGDRSADRGAFELAAATAQRDGAEKRDTMLHVGGIVQYVWNVWKQTDDPRAAEQLLRFINDLAKAAYETGAMAGMYQENIDYILKYDETAQAKGSPVLPSRIVQLPDTVQA
jgi:hypothetical protein